MTVLKKHTDSIFEWSGKYGLFTNYVAEIPTTGDCISVPPFRMNKPKRDAIELILQEYLDRGIVEPSKSSWNTPTFLLKKQHDIEESMPSKLWPVVEDYRQLNKVIVDDVFDPPSVDEIIDIVGRHNKFYCSVDLRRGYHHIPLKVRDREKTCFSTGRPAGKLQYRVLPYGLKHVGQIFQRRMEKILNGLINVCCLEYVDDILIFGENIDNMIKNLDLILGRIATKGGSKIQQNRAFWQRK
jgi:Reverse transcriptase (RNA-dependent DNA polymerase)